MTRLNITLPDEIAKEIADKHNKSRFIAEALKEKLDREKQKQIENSLWEGYNAASKEDAKLQADWEKTETEGWK
ncbi:MAG: ribbon-helix-helix domain-containing protein [Candidatus Omnitrophica bacterium]|nr:ribbon-helix-helix domain-containing protein [Candidatus Omnitrophota bacterium]